MVPAILPKVKEPTTFEQQVEILRSRGLIIRDKDEAIEVLKRVNYYRLTGYTLSLKKHDKFFEGITFDTIYNLYEFDHKLRALIMGALENIEIAFRTNIAYLLAHKYGARGYLNPENFKDSIRHIRFLGHLINDIDRADELFVEHHKVKYNSQFPVWVALELISFSDLSKLFSNMKNEDKQAISKNYYGVPHNYVSSWLYVLTAIRNICAHYGRLYNRKINAPPRLSSEDSKLGFDNYRVFAGIFVMKKLYTDKNAWNNFVINLQALIDQYSDVNCKLLGFSGDWKKILGEYLESK